MKPREWWITEIQDDNGLFFKQASDLEPLDRGQWITHTIEFSAYDNLKIELVKAREALEQLADPQCYEEPEPSNPETGYFEPYRISPSEIAKQALKSIPKIDV